MASAAAGEALLASAVVYVASAACAPFVVFVADLVVPRAPVLAHVAPRDAHHYTFHCCLEYRVVIRVDCLVGFV